MSKLLTFGNKKQAFLDSLSLMDKVKEEGYKPAYNAFTGHIYSLRNQCLISFLGGQEGAYAGYQDWKRKGFKVLKGQHGVPIARPILFKDKTKDKKEQLEEMRGITFGTIFHHSQVAPIQDQEQAIILTSSI